MLDDIAQALSARDIGCEGADLARSLEQLDPEAIWWEVVGPMLDDLEERIQTITEGEPE